MARSAVAIKKKPLRVLAQGLVLLQAVNVLAYQPPTSASMMFPKRSQASPLNLMS